MKDSGNEELSTAAAQAVKTLRVRFGAEGFCCKGQLRSLAR